MPHPLSQQQAAEPQKPPKEGKMREERFEKLKDT